MGRLLRSGGLLYFILLMVFAVILVRVLSSGDTDVQVLNSQEFQETVRSGEIDTSIPEGEEGTLMVLDEDQTVEGTLQNGERFEYSYPSEYDIAAVFDEQNIPFTTDPQNTGFWLTLLGTLGPILLIVLFLLLFLSMSQGGGNRVMSFGKSKAKRMTQDTPKVTFADVAGADEAVQELTEIKEFLESPQKFQKLGARIPKGALLVGPPGTGKTLLARAVAGEAGVPYFSISGSDFVEMFVGVGASVTGDTPVLIRDEKGTRLVPIEEFVDDYYADGEEDFVVPVSGVETLGYERRESGFRGRLDGFAGSAWKGVRGVYRHKVAEILEIEYLGGTIRTTGDHSVFVRGRGGIKPKAARDLEPGEVLVDLPYKTRRSFIPGLGTPHEVRAHRFDEADEPRILPIVDRDAELAEAYEYALANAGRLSQRAIAERVGVSQATVGHWQSNEHEPRGISTRNARTKIPAEVELTPSLMKLFGYYAAEGRANGALEFCFGTHEGDLIEDCSALMREVFGMEPTIEETGDNSTRLHYRSAALGRFFAKHCGNGSRNKHIPELLWALPEPYLLAFLEGYSEGDGYTSSDGKLIITSVSQRLIRELVWLCSMHGIKGGVRHGTQEGGRVIHAKPLPEGEYWTFIIGKTSNPFADGMPTHEHKKPVIRKITRVPYDGYVYDLCGCDNEAFFGGEKPVLLHNSRVRDLFEQAKQNSPCIIFMDEIDAVGRQRGAGMGGGHDEREQTLNQLLVEMDGFDSQSGIIMLAATNRPDILDPALLRPGRFDRQIVVDRPDLPGRERILRVHTRGKPLGDDIDISNVAKGTPGFTGADLANLINEAALLAARHNKEVIEQEEMEEAVDRVIAGPERKTRLISDREKEITAFHEAGHAIVGALLPNADPVHKISIIPRGQALGVTMSLPEEDRFMMSRAQMMDQLSMMLGGRAAERVVFDEVTTGASNDIERVTKTARAMVTRYGMSEKLGLIALGNSDGQVFMGRDFNSQPDYSDEIAFQIDREIRRIVDESYDTAEDLLIRNRELLDKLSADLIEYETVDAAHLKRLIAEYAVDKPRFESDSHAHAQTGGPNTGPAGRNGSGSGAEAREE